MNVPLNKGVTLVEVMVVLLILGIILSVGVPSARSFIQKSQLKSLTLELSSSLWLARNQALSRGKVVSICAKSAGVAASCASSGGQWQNGWIVYEGKTLTADSQIIKEVALSTGAFVVKNPKTQIEFSGRGVRLGGGGEWSVFVGCRHSASNWRELMIEPSGYIHVQILQEGPYDCPAI